MIGPKIALTAYHNIPMLAKELNFEMDNDREYFKNINLEGVQIFLDQPIANEQGVSVKLSVVSIARSEFATDIAVLFLESSDKFEDHWKRCYMAVNFGLPLVGREVAAFGFPDAEVHAVRVENELVLNLKNSAILAHGIVEKLCPSVGSGVRNFPSFEVGTIWPGGMSGGPVFQNGGVVGLVAGGVSYVTSDDSMRAPHTSEWPVPDDEPVSLGMVLWPLFGDEFSLPFVTEGRSFSFRDLAMHVPGLEDYWVNDIGDPTLKIYRSADGNKLKIGADSLEHQSYMEVSRYESPVTFDEIIRGRR
ncbi:hypothetical protein GCM10008019_28830 [Deinococcus soli (ex Cha et al. 2016)]|nr:hypothetical protein GCM10008019_28830 [Deinococcus soli (ex Cha et al. 2016)]